MFLTLHATGITPGPPPITVLWLLLTRDVGFPAMPFLTPPLSHHPQESGMLSINIGDSTVEYNEKFRFYVTTKLPRPHYKPEISVKVTLLNFAITPTGLQDQLLQKVVQFEERELRPTPPPPPPRLCWRSGQALATCSGGRPA